MNDETLLRASINRRTLMTGVGTSALILATGSSAIAADTTMPAPGKGQKTGAASDRLAYVSSYTPEGKGITLWRVAGATGALTLVKTFEADNPSWIALDAAHHTLYAVNENEPEGGVTAYAIDPATGDLSKINTVSSKGKWPCHLSVHPSGKFVLAANYGTGTVAVFPILANGGVGEASDVQGNPGPLNPAQAKDSPPGQTGPSDHSGPHFHMVQADPAGRFIIANDAGRDQIVRWSLDVATGKLSAAPSPILAVEAGSAPRHFAFHPSGRIIYNLQEQDGIVSVYHYDPETAALTPMQSLSLFAPGFAGSFLGSELALSPNGRFLYAAARLVDTITVFAINRDGSLTRSGETWTRNDYPRSFAIDPSGTFLFACNQKGNAVTTFRINPHNGALDFTGHFAPVGSPVSMVFL
ncbi:MAG: lactonase family protein [Azospirillaceae bacterium]|nr:lactonase family protein [Azospirillaceae bacterium]